MRVRTGVEPPPPYPPDRQADARVGRHDAIADAQLFHRHLAVDRHDQRAGMETDDVYRDLIVDQREIILRVATDDREIDAPSALKINLEGAAIVMHA